MPVLNYPGSSQYGVNAAGIYGPMYTPPPVPQTSTGSDPGDYGVYDPASGRVISIKTGKPFTGKDPHSGQMYKGGVLDQAAAGMVQVPGGGQINPNDPNQRYKPVDIIKSPDVASATSDLMASFKKGAGDALKGFDEYLTQFKSDLSAARTKGAAATDIGPTTAALTTAQNRYSTGLDTATKEYQDALAASAANQRGIIAKEQAALPSYDTALSNIENQNLAEVMGNLSRYKLGTGTPRSLGSAESQILASEATRTALPIEMAKINKQYDIYGQALPVEANIAGQNITYAGGYLPNTAGAQYSSATNLANTIQSLKAQTAGMSYQQALQFLQAAGVPPQIMQQILGGQATNLNQILGLETGSRYQGLQDTLGVYPSQPNYYSIGQPGYPAPNRYGVQYPNTSTGTAPMTAPNAPVQVGPPPWPGTGIDYNAGYQAWMGTPQQQAAMMAGENDLGVYPSSGYAAWAGTPGQRAGMLADEGG